jgi:hypothetical protein
MNVMVVVSEKEYMVLSICDIYRAIHCFISQFMNEPWIFQISVSVGNFCLENLSCKVSYFRC